MVESVVTTMPHKSIGHIQEIMAKNNIKSVPVVDGDDEVKWIITSTDILEDHNKASPISTVIYTKVYTIPTYSDVTIAARIVPKSD